MSKPPNTMSIEKVRKLLRYEPDTGNFYWLVNRRCIPAGYLAGHLGQEGYVRIQIMGRFYRASRVAWALTHNKWPDEESELDHINGNKADNRISNLREATHTGNAANNNGWRDRSSKLKGAYRHRARWRTVVS